MVRWAFRISLALDPPQLLPPQSTPVPEEPLVFIHCALVPDLADTMAYIADNTGADADEEGAGAAIFYSITSTQVTFD